MDGKLWGGRLGVQGSGCGSTGEDGEATVGLGDVVDQLHDDNGLADTRTAEEADLATLGVRLNQINDLSRG